MDLAQIRLPWVGRNPRPMLDCGPSVGVPLDSDSGDQLDDGLRFLAEAMSSAGADRDYPGITGPHQPRVGPALS